VDVDPEPQLLHDSGITTEDAAGYHFRAAKGCRDCRGLGYRGRKAIAELLILNDEIRELIAARAPARQIKEAARRNGTRTLREAAVATAGRGETTLEEINRVTFVA
jgi:general secretion pathway protein E